MDPHALSDDEIVRLCQDYSTYNLHLLSNKANGRRIIKLSIDVVVKFGLGVTLQEARAQQLAFQKVGQNILRIPQVYRSFTRPDSKFRSTGYIMMENIDGFAIEHSDWQGQNLLHHVVAALNRLHSISSESPGSVSGGESHGVLWSEYGSQRAFRMVEDLEFYLNERLAYFKSTIRIRKEELCFCHMDASPRNFLLDTQGRLCLLDWANAGFYPRYFELWSIEFARHIIGSNFGHELLLNLKATPAEQSGIQKLSLVYRYNSHYSL